MEEVKESNEIIKAKIVNGVFLEVTYNQIRQDCKNEFNCIFKHTPHDDLKKAFDKLKYHVGFLCELFDANVFTRDMLESEDPLLVMIAPSISVTGISLGGSDEHSGVTIIARKTLRGNKVLNLITPFCKYEDFDGQENYKFNTELYYATLMCVHEVEEYLNGKHAPKAQLEIAFDEKINNRLTI